MKLLKIALISYAIKTVLIGAAWLAIPDLPQKALAAARHTWAWVSSSAEDAAGHEPVEGAARPPADASARATR